MARDAAPSQYERRRQATERKLREALERLLAEGGKLTVARLAREAKVARNAIYTNHLSIIEVLEQAQQRQQAAAPRRAGLLEQQRAEIEALKQERQQLVTENAALLKRALDGEASAAQHARQHARLVQEWDQQHRPALVTPRR